MTPEDQPGLLASPTVLTPFSTLDIAAPQQLTAPDQAHYYLTIMNTGTSAVYVSNLSSVGADATSFTLPAGATMPPLLIYGPVGVWVATDTTGSISVLLQPKP